MPWRQASESIHAPCARPALFRCSSPRYPLYGISRPNRTKVRTTCVLRASDALSTPGVDFMTATTAPVATPSPTPIAPARKAKVSRLPVYPGSAQALAMLTLLPVFATPVPRLRVEPRAPDGRLIVYDRALN